MNHRDEDAGKGAVEQDRRGQKTNVSLTGQNGHRDQDPLLKSGNSDFPEPGQNEEHTGEPHTRNELERDTEIDPEGAMPEPGPRRPAKGKPEQDERRPTGRLSIAFGRRAYAADSECARSGVG